MMKNAYEEDPYLQQLSTEVLDVRLEDHRYVVVTADTIFYPEGGGQPADRGTIAGSSVVDVKKTEGVVSHLVEAEVKPGPADMKLDWQRRFDHMQQHTGQHLLTAIAADRFGWQTTAFHLGDHVCDIELRVPDLTADDLRLLEDAVNVEILGARAVTARTVSIDQFENLPVRSRGLPDGHEGDVRLVEIEGLDLNTCGGTHLRSTSELGCLCLLGSERLRGGIRVFFAAGSRIRRMMVDHENRTARLRRILDASTDSLVDEVERREFQSRALSKRLKNTLNQLALSESARLASSSERLVACHWQDQDMPFLQTIARDLAVRAPSTLALLTSGDSGDGVFLVSAGPQTALEISSIGTAVEEVLGGRGGGRGLVYQGKASRIDRRNEALTLIKNLLD